MQSFLNRHIVMPPNCEEPVWVGSISLLPKDQLFWHRTKLTSRQRHLGSLTVSLPYLSPAFKEPQNTGCGSLYFMLRWCFLHHLTSNPDADKLFCLEVHQTLPSKYNASCLPDVPLHSFEAVTESLDFNDVIDEPASTNSCRKFGGGGMCENNYLHIVSWWWLVCRF